MLIYMTGLIRITSYIVLCFSLCANNSYSSVNTRVNWKSIRDNNIVKQSTDYSCGSSSVATILKYFYLTDTSEREVLSRLPNLDDDLSASLLELSKAVESYV
ncbi:hypothetical protein NBRC116587_16230 [Pseudoteredinibacter isoporae]